MLRRRTHAISLNIALPDSATTNNERLLEIFGATDQDDIPEQFLDSIFHVVMDKPVRLIDDETGHAEHIVDKNLIIELWKKNPELNGRNPFTRAKTTLHPVHELESKINEYMDTYRKFRLDIERSGDGDSTIRMTKENLTLIAARRKQILQNNEESLTEALSKELRTLDELEEQQTRKLEKYTLSEKEFLVKHISLLTNKDNPSPKEAKKLEKYLRLFDQPPKNTEILPPIPSYLFKRKTNLSEAVAREVSGLGSEPPPPSPASIDAFEGSADGFPTETSSHQSPTLAVPITQLQQHLNYWYSPSIKK